MFCVFLTSCVKNDVKNNRVNIKEFSSVVFDGYDYDYEAGIVKPNAEMSNIIISKNEMKKNDFYKIDKKIIKDGWVRRDFYKGLYIYCKGVYNKLGILYPEGDNYYDRGGSEIIIGDFNDWLIYYVYNSNGVNGCK